MLRPLAPAVMMMLLAACMEPAPGRCDVTITSVIQLPPGELCAVTPTGLVLRIDDGSEELVLERLSQDGTLTRLTSVSADWRCGAVAEDPASGTVWLAAHDPVLGFDGADQLLELDANGRRPGQTVLFHPLAFDARAMAT